MGISVWRLLSDIDTKPVHDYCPKQNNYGPNSKRDILKKYIDDNHDCYGEKLLKIYERYINYLDDNEDEAFKELEVEIVCMLLNVSDVIGSDDWSKKLLDDLKIWEVEDTPQHTWNKVSEIPSNNRLLSYMVFHIAGSKRSSFSLTIGGMSLSCGYIHGYEITMWSYFTTTHPKYG